MSINAIYCTCIVVVHDESTDKSTPQKPQSMEVLLLFKPCLPAQSKMVHLWFRWPRYNLVSHHSAYKLLFFFETCLKYYRPVMLHFRPFHAISYEQKLAPDTLLGFGGPCVQRSMASKIINIARFSFICQLLLCATQDLYGNSSQMGEGVTGSRLKGLSESHLISRRVMEEVIPGGHIDWGV